MTDIDTTETAVDLSALEVPALTGMQRQGDVWVVPVRPSAKAGAPVPAAGIPVVRGENGGNTHLLLASGAVTWAPTEDRSGQNLGVVMVHEGATAWLQHPEHGANAMAPGCYSIRRQREQSDVIRLVAD